MDTTLVYKIQSDDVKGVGQGDDRAELGALDYMGWN